MDDLSSVEWAVPKPSVQSTNQHNGPRGNYYPTLRPTTPMSGASTPSNGVLTGQGQKPLSNVSTGTKTSTPTGDSFANLISFNASQSTKTLSLQEQQRTLQEQKTKAEEERSRQFDAHFGAKPLSALSRPFGNGDSTSTRNPHPPTYAATDEYGGQKLSKIINKPFAGIPPISLASTSKATTGDDDDLLAAFNADAPVDKSSYMPPVATDGSLNKSDGSGAGVNEASRQVAEDKNGFLVDDDDDDPFGLGTIRPAPLKDHSGREAPQDEDDVLGLLGRPVSEFPKTSPVEVSFPPKPHAESVKPQDAAHAELVEMGFSTGKSRIALESTESGTDVQAAVGWLLNHAHEDSRKKNRSQQHPDSDEREGPQVRRVPGRRKSSGASKKKPAWMRERSGPSTSQERDERQIRAEEEKDAAQYASEIGNNLFKTAGSLWKTGTKKLNQAVSEFNSDSDSSQPKWMREAQAQGTPRRLRTHERTQKATQHDRAGEVGQKEPRPQLKYDSVTDEALLLESGDVRSTPRRPAKRPQDHSQSSPSQPSKEQLPQRITKAQELVQSQPRFPQQRQPRGTAQKLSRQAVEEEAAQAYISPARRKKAASKPAPPGPEADLFFGEYKPATGAPTSKIRPRAATSTRPSTTSTPSIHPSPPKRAIPAISPSALQSSTSSRHAGSDAFKRGDYAQATTYYSNSLSVLPQNHPLMIPVLTNRTLSHLKTGDPKAAIVDATTVFDFIGPNRGLGESIELGGDEGVKSMENYWGKAMTRKAEAFEQLERWREGAAAWRTCVEAGVGGATSIAGRNRCENATRPDPPPTKRPPARATPRPPALNDLTPSTGQSTEAVTRLRAANAAADKLDDEKFALADIVDARVTKWRAGKEGNLRALLSSLENVLWGDSGWKKVGMGDLLLPGKVKLVYMKGIAKVHPDKVSLLHTQTPPPR